MASNREVKKIKKYIVLLSVIGVILIAILYNVIHREITKEQPMAWCGVVDTDKGRYIEDTVLHKKIATILKAEFDQNTGRKLFLANCSACHSFDRKIVGPPLTGFIDRIPHKSIKWLHNFIRTQDKTMEKDAYVIKLKKEYNSNYNHGFMTFDEKNLNDLIGFILMGPPTLARGE